jgi:hypothetical protein
MKEIVPAPAIPIPNKTDDEIRQEYHALRNSPVLILSTIHAAYLAALESEARKRQLNLQ